MARENTTLRQKAEWTGGVSTRSVGTTRGSGQWRGQVPWRNARTRLVRWRWKEGWVRSTMRTERQWGQFPLGRVNQHEHSSSCERWGAFLTYFLRSPLAAWWKKVCKREAWKQRGGSRGTELWLCFSSVERNEEGAGSEYIFKMETNGICWKL